MDQSKIAAIILAAGRGTRLKSTTTNKVALPFAGRPIITYAVDLVKDIAGHVVIVVGAFEDSVRAALKDYPQVIYAKQAEQLGTGDAAAAGWRAIEKNQPDIVLLGYGDHMMFYKPETIVKLVTLHMDSDAVMTLVTVMHEQPDELAWGRIIRDETGNIVRSVEHKDASDDERTVNELNAGFYVLDAGFLRENISKIPRSEVTQEYYVNSLIEIAAAGGSRVSGLVVPFEQVGIGINRPEELEASQALHASVNGKSEA